MNEPLVTIIIPTWNNPEDLPGCVTSILRTKDHFSDFKVLVINNGHKNSCDYLKGVDQVEVIDSGENLGWEGGIDLGLQRSTSPYVCFLNDDTLVPPSSANWLDTMLTRLKNTPSAGAVGPSSNVVMGAQNIFIDQRDRLLESTFIIGFCAFILREAFEKSGGMDMSLPGGDDIDWSIRLRQAGYKIFIDRTVFIYHHGFKTGNRVYGDFKKRNGWNSFEQYDKTHQALIKKHGLKVWFETMSQQIVSHE